MDAREAEKAGDRVAIVSWLQAFGRQTGARDVEVGRWLLAAERTRAFELPGASSIFELAEKLLGWEGRTTHERLRVARALEKLPRAAEALGGGEIHWTKVRELSRIAVPSTEAEWLERAQQCSVRDLEALVAGRRPGDRPGDPPDSALVRKRLAFELGAEAWATWLEAVDWVRREVDTKLSEEEALLHLLRRARAGGQEGQEDGEGMVRRAPSHQVALTVCVACQQGFQLGGGQETPVPNPVTERAACDSECIGFVEPEMARLAAAHVGTVGLPPAYAAHVGRDRRRKSRGIRPNVERDVRWRDKDRCQVPGCNQRHYTEIHHLEMVMDGGTDDAENLLVICTTHHKLLHEGRLWAERSPRGLVFWHADGTQYGIRLTPGSVEVNGQAFTALRGMGIRERDVRYCLRAARAELERAGVSTPSVEELVTEALRQSRRGKMAPQVREGAPAYGALCPRGHEAGAGSVPSGGPGRLAAA